MPNERYIGDGVYASLDPAQMIVLRTDRVETTTDAPSGFEGLKIGDTPVTVWDRHVRHWIALEPEVLTELMRFAFDIGWGDLILRIARKQLEAAEEAEYARAEEQAGREAPK